MKVGSIVEYVKQSGHKEIPHGCVLPRLKQPYTVMAIQQRDRMSILLEEIRNPLSPKGREWGYNMADFRELLPPMEIQSALDECETVLIKL